MWAVFVVGRRSNLPVSVVKRKRTWCRRRVLEYCVALEADVGILKFGTGR